MIISKLVFFNTSRKGILEACTHNYVKDILEECSMCYGILIPE